MKSQKEDTQKSETNLSPEAQILAAQLPIAATPMALAPVQNLPLPEPLPAAPPVPLPVPAHPRRRRSKLMELDLQTFDSVNQDIEDGIPYQDIIGIYSLAEHGITIHTLSKWRTGGGFAEWREEDTRRAELKRRFESIADLVQKQDGNKLHEVGFHLAAAKICDLLDSLDTTALRQKLQGDPNAFAQLLKSMSTLSEADMACEKHRISMDAHWNWQKERRAEKHKKFKAEVAAFQQTLEAQAAQRRQAQSQQAAQPQPPNPPPAQPPPPNPPQT